MGGVWGGGFDFLAKRREAGGGGGGGCIFWPRRRRRRWFKKMTASPSLLLTHNAICRIIFVIITIRLRKDKQCYVQNQVPWRKIANLCREPGYILLLTIYALGIWSHIFLYCFCGIFLNLFEDPLWTTPDPSPPSFHPPTSFTHWSPLVILQPPSDPWPPLIYC